MAKALDLPALLSASRAAHQQAKQARREGRIDAHLEHLTTAAAYRLSAHDSDPTHTDSAWAEDRQRGFLHDLLMIFYADELAKDHTAVKSIVSERVKKATAVVAASVRQ